MKTLIKAGLVYPVVSAPMPNRGIAIEDGKITAVGQISEFNESDFNNFIDLSEQVVLPGFVNAHCHLQFSALRGKILPGPPFVDWIRKIISLHYSQSEEEIMQGFRAGTREMIETGTTAVGDISNDVKYALALADSPLTGVAFAEFIEPVEEKAEESAKKARDTIAAYKKSRRATGVSPHAPYTVSGELFKKLKAFALEDSMPFTVHLAESPEEDEYIRNGNGALADLLVKRGYPGAIGARNVSPVQLLENYGVLDGALAVHLNQIDSDDREILIKRRVVPVFCPGSSAWFGRKKVMPLKDLFDLGLNPALGTDSLASNSSLSMLDELRAAEKFFPNISRKDLLECATINGAKALGLNCGGIEKGKNADIIAVGWSSLSNPVDAVFSTNRVNFVMIGGVEVL
ncbi:MAG: amidohydrolase family protein [Nitrospinae bacterium]|nr:amidohydrolase family protein [Nitrospinota bacterium]